MKKLFNLKMVEGTPMAQHLNEFNTITNQLSSMEIVFDDEIRALIVLASLPNSCEAMRMAVNNSAGKSKLKYDDIQDLILSEEVCRRDVGISNAQDQALVMENRGRNRSRGLDDRAKSNDRSHSKGRSQFKEMGEYFHCGKNGHIQRNCWHWNKEQTEEKDEKNDDEKNTAVVVLHEDVLMLSLQEQKCMHVAKNDVEWVVDSAASHHVIPTKRVVHHIQSR